MNTELDVSGILTPPETGADDKTEENFVHYYPHSKPLIENQIEYFSSIEERMAIATPRLLDLSQKKAAQKRMRIIILADIIIFIVILGVIYPSLRKLQTKGKLNGYRFSIEQSHDALLVKTERLISSKSQATQYQIQILSGQQQIYRGQSELPSLDSPVKYALFPLSSQAQDFDIIIRVEQEERKFFLSIAP